MIRVDRIPLEDELCERLNRRSQLLARRGADSKSARRSWKGATVERAGIRYALFRIAAGVERCMYCGDSRGTDVDHFEPIKLAPLRTFDWHNHLLACSSCNSNAKRDAWPCDKFGQSLLVDPSVEDPADHLKLALTDGTYTGVSEKGRVTVKIFQLNRADLRKGRADAFIRCKSMLRDYVSLKALGKPEEALSTKLALEGQPFADVLYAMYKVADSPGAAIVLGGSDVVKILRIWRENLKK